MRALALKSVNIKASALLIIIHECSMLARTTPFFSLIQVIECNIMVIWY